MFFLKKKPILCAVANGRFIPIENVQDDVFSSKMLGEGFGISQHDGKIVAPIDGKITNIFPTKHAITITTEQGASVLVHMGIDTVDLKGEGFELFVSENEYVQTGDCLAKVDNQFLTEKGKDTTIITVVPEIKSVKIVNSKEMVTPKDKILVIES